MTDDTKSKTKTEEKPIECPDMPADTTGPLTLKLPGGAEITGIVPKDIADDVDKARSVLGTAAAAMAPLMPIFNLIDVLLTMQKIAKAIPDVLGPPPDPTKIVQLLPELAKKIDKLIGIVPQLSVPIFIRSLIDSIITFLRGLNSALSLLAVWQSQLDLADVAADEVAALGEEYAAEQMRIANACGRTAVAAQYGSIMQGMAPLNVIIELATTLMQIAGLPPLPDLSHIGPEVPIAEASSVLNDAVSALSIVQSALPG